MTGDSGVTGDSRIRWSHLGKRQFIILVLQQLQCSYPAGSHPPLVIHYPLNIHYSVATPSPPPIHYPPIIHCPVATPHPYSLSIDDPLDAGTHLPMKELDPLLGEGVGPRGEGVGARRDRKVDAEPMLCDEFPPEEGRRRKADRRLSVSGHRYGISQ
jgi:hypothetical protein